MRISVLIPVGSCWRFDCVCPHCRLYQQPVYSIACCFGVVQEEVANPPARGESCDSTVRRVMKLPFWFWMFNFYFK